MPEREERRGDFILTYSGRRFWPLDPRPEDIDIEDIAHALANLCRFTGHTSRFYAVAEHSVHVSDSASAPHKLWGLLHDAPEAYLGDLARPTKQAHAGFGLAYRRVERRLMLAICERFELLTVEPLEVLALDDLVLETEAEALMPPLPGGRRWTGNRPIAGLKINCWSSPIAKATFLARFHRLYGGESS